MHEYGNDGDDSDTMTFSSFDFVKGKQKSNDWIERCADDLQRQFGLQNDVSLDEVKRFVLFDTPWPFAIRSLAPLLMHVVSNVRKLFAAR